MVMNREEIEKHLKKVEPLDQFLTNRGVNITDLNKSKNDYVDYMPEFAYYYDYKEEQTELAWIDTDNIHAPARFGNSGHSWYNLLSWGVYGLPNNKDANISSANFYDLLTNLKKMDFSELKDLYENGSSILSLYKFNKYEKTGEKPIYIGINDGTHRIVLAKVLGVNYVTSKMVNVYEYNAEKHKIHQDLNAIIEKLQTFLQNSNAFNLVDGEFIKINGSRFTYMGVIFEDINPTTFNKNTYEYIEHIKILNRYYAILKEIEDAYNKQINIYKYIPKGILNFMSLAHKNIYLEAIEDYKKQLLKKVKILKALDL
ncbi:hypothetical protein [Staphylococcus cohnii]|uniref:hypothetical protein n=1 Tax=Staphylococcus cohnii TaxID=29382 RepID=UPI003D7F0F60